MSDPTRSLPDATHSVAGTGSVVAAVNSTVPVTSSPPAAPHPLPAVPGYDLSAEIGRGGMGVVYRARDVGIGRDVAVKLLQERYVPKSQVASRFLEEARITGQLQHPGIPAVHQVGALPDGRPYLAMKLIKGATLDDLLNAGPVNTLAVFEAICQAVGYAHAHGVIHRDLKPANVIVGSFGEVQVMDWELAKALTPGTATDRERVDDPDATRDPTEIHSARDADTPFTQYGSAMGTPAFMAPEQAGGEWEKVDRRADVFGLGAILCKLLTGRPPFDGKTTDEVKLNAVRGNTAAALAHLDDCGAEPGLVSLCRQCLSFDPAARPADANAVTSAVAAGPDWCSSTTGWCAADANAVTSAVAALRTEAEERAKQAELDKAKAEVQVAEQRKRRRVWLGLAGTLTIGLLTAVTLAIRADHSRRDAVLARQDADDRRTEAETRRTEADTARQKEAEARQKAEEETKLSNGVKDFLKFDLLQLADPVTQREDGKLAFRFDVKLSDVVLRAAEAISSKFPDHPLVEAELRWIIGYTLSGMGRPDLAVIQDERRRAICTAHLGPDHPDTLQSMGNLACSYAALGRLQEALKLREETLTLRRAKLGDDHPDTLWGMSQLASSYTDLGRYPEALKLDAEALAARRAKLGDDHPDTLMSMSSLATDYATVGRWRDSLKLREETLALQKAKLGDDHPDTLSSMNNLAVSYTTVARHREVLELRERTLALRKAKLGDDHPHTLLSMSALANSYAALGRHDDAIKLREETLTLRKATLGNDHPDTLVSARGEISSLIQLRRFDDALPRIDAVLKLMEQIKAKGDTPDARSWALVVGARLIAFRERKDASGCRETIERHEQFGLADDLNSYNAACGRAILAGLLTGDAARTEAEKAMDWLRKAVAAGYKNVSHMKQDKGLDPLRDRDDFKKLIADLEAASPPKREVLPPPHRE